MRQATDDLTTSSVQAHTLTRRAALGGIAAASVAVPAAAAQMVPTGAAIKPDDQVQALLREWLDWSDAHSLRSVSQS